MPDETNETSQPTASEGTTEEGSESNSPQKEEATGFKGNLADAAAASIAPAQTSPEGGETPPAGEGEEWWLTPEIKGEGEKPDFLDTKQYKSLYEQAKGTPGLRKQLGGFTGAPEKYEIKLGEDNKEIEIDTDDALFKDFTELAHKNNMSEEMYNDCLRAFVSYTGLQNGYQEKELEEFQKMELEKMGGPKEAGEKISEMCQWYKQNFPHVKDEIIQDLKDMMYFSGAYDLVRTFRDKMTYAHLPTGNQVEVGKSRNELQKMISDPKYLSDPAYQEMVNAEYGKKMGK